MSGSRGRDGVYHVSKMAGPWVLDVDDALVFIRDVRRGLRGRGNSIRSCVGE